MPRDASPPGTATRRRRAVRTAIRGLGVLALLLAGGGCATIGPVPRVPTLAEAAADPSPEEQLRRDIREIVTDPLTTHAVWAVVVNSLETGRSLYSLNAFTHLIPASNQKLVIGAVAAERLGWQFRFETRLVAMGPIEDGRLRGDLVVVGNGDPTINDRHPERMLAFDDWARQLRNAGVQLIEGNLVGDDSAFTQPGWGAGWEWDDLRFGYAAQIGALQFNENEVEITAGPGMIPGAPAIVTVGPAGSGLLVDSRVVTGAFGTVGALDVRRLPGSRILELRGSVPLGGTPLTAKASVENPTIAYLGALEAALARNDVMLKGRTFDADDLPVRPDPAAGRTLITDVSPPLRDMVDVMMKWSRNAYAESLLRAMDTSGPPATAEGGVVSVRQTLARWGIGPDRYVARDGSGLSRYNFASADMLTALLTYTWIDPAIFDLYFESLPEAGRSGTLAHRLRGTPAEGRVRAKTGTMTHARALSGYVRTLDGEPLVFSIIANNHLVSPAEIDARVDRMLLKLVAFSRSDRN